MVARNARTFVARLEARNKEMKARAAAHLNELTLDGRDLWIERLPRRTGRLQASVAVSAGTVGPHRVPAGAPSYDLRSRESWGEELRGAPLEAKRFLYSRVPYAQAVEDREHGLQLTRQELQVR